MNEFIIIDIVVAKLVQQDANNTKVMGLIHLMHELYSFGCLDNIREQKV